MPYEHPFLYPFRTLKNFEDHGSCEDAATPLQTPGGRRGMDQYFLESILRILKPIVDNIRSFLIRHIKTASLETFS